MKFPSNQRPALAAFTMVEVALALAIIGFALVAIVGVLPQGLNIQRDNREDTLVSQDGPFLLEAIRSGSKGIEALTNSVDRMDIVSYVRGTLETNQVSPPFIAQSPSNIVGILSIPVGAPVRIPQQGGRGMIGGTMVQVLTVMRPLGAAAVDHSTNSFDLAFRYMVASQVIAGPDSVSLPDDPNIAGNENGPLLNTVRLHFNWPLTIGVRITDPVRVGTRGQRVFRTEFAGRIASPPDSQGNPNGMTYFAQPNSF